MTKRVLLVSANGGVGLAVARKLIARRYSVIATVSRPEKLDEFRRRIPGCERVMALDLTDDQRIAEVVGEVAAGTPPLDGVIVCAAISPFAPAETTPLAAFRAVMQVNCVSHLQIYQCAMPALRQSRGRIVFIGSVSGRVATPMMAAYCASKFALEGLTDVMRQEARAFGVDVVLLQPGTIDTPIVARSRDSLAAALRDLPEPERALYGTLYAQIKHRVDIALNGHEMMPADLVADALIHALEVARPEARYPIGSEADFLLAASRSKSDRELDDLILGVYQSTP
jgi:NAD(P)-dependent dehydrogenase (short-subunit alcohol dehydrogenase family)